MPYQSENYPTYVHVPTSAEMKKDIIDHAREMGVGQAAVVRWAIREYLARQQADAA
ncbi:CopG family transcriptional regulator [Ruegeria arenilitoris]|uniref:ribbon-helix-helix domain-containing protein n=1 Tax=Ruegeria arenilitoris TaxID=1173585 RepID=UPI003C7A9B4E